jgi:hypothetical protein
VTIGFAAVSLMAGGLLWRYRRNQPAARSSRRASTIASTSTGGGDLHYLPPESEADWTEKRRSAYFRQPGADVKSGPRSSFFRRPVADSAAVCVLRVAVLARSRTDADDRP